MEYMEYIIAIITGVCTAIPLIVKLVSVVQANIKEKNWNKMLEMLMGFMEVAEEKFETGAEKKEYVMAMIKASADEIDYPLDMKVISDMIDSLCAMSKKVNVQGTKNPKSK
jgi:hypothetical protein